MPETLTPLQLSMLQDAVDHYHGHVYASDAANQKPFKRNELKRLQELLRRADTVEVKTL